VNNVGIVGEKAQQPNDIISRIKNTSSAIGQHKIPTIVNG